jgi:hypothetical protein
MLWLPLLLAQDSYTFTFALVIAVFATVEDKRGMQKSRRIKRREGGR